MSHKNIIQDETSIHHYDSKSKKDFYPVPNLKFHLRGKNFKSDDDEVILGSV